MRPGPLDNICDVPGVLVGHASDREGLTGCTAILFDPANGGEAIVGVDVRGSSPGTRETDRLAPTATIDVTHAVLLSGGSAFGLAAADGIVRFLEEQGVGIDLDVVKVPLVSGAVLFDLMFGSPNARPDAQMGYEAAMSATSGDFEQGDAGAGTGATVGKILGMDRSMNSGLGSASFVFDDGLAVGAIVAVNALGDIREDGEIIAGPRLEDGSFGDSLELMPQVAAALGWTPKDGQNTTIGLVATNAKLTKTQATKVAQMSHDGYARTIYPSHSTLDGDTIFAASTGEIPASVDVVGGWCAKAMETAILRAVRSAKSVGGLPGLAG